MFNCTFVQAATNSFWDFHGFSNESDKQQEGMKKTKQKKQNSEEEKTRIL